MPTVAALRQRTPEAILDALVTGAMRQQGAELTDAERRAVAEFLGGRPLGRVATVANAGRCANPAPFDPAQGAGWTGWGPDSSNARFQPAAQAGLTPESTPRLKLKWAFGFPDCHIGACAADDRRRARVRRQPGRHGLFARRARPAASIWTFKAKASVRTAIVLGARRAGPSTPLYFGDGRANVYALNASTGTPALDAERRRRIPRRTSPVLRRSIRIGCTCRSRPEKRDRANNKNYECCTFRGSLVALDLANGNVVWKTYTIPTEPRTLGRNAGGAVRWGPSGAGVWGSPAVDAKRHAIYAATGNMYTEPQQGSSDAVIAFDLDNGKILWTAQVTPKDVFVVGCNQPDPANCPVGDDVGPDFDFGNAPMLVTTPGGRDLIVIGQKSGVGWALDPDNKGAVVWQYRAGQGSALGGMEFGSASDGVNAYFPVNDGIQPTAGEIHAVRLDTGETAWKAMPRPVLCGHARPRLLPGCGGGGDGDSRRAVHRCDGRRAARLRDEGRVDALGVRHEPRLHHRQRRAGEGRVDQRRRRGDRRRHAVRQLRLRRAGRPSGQRAARLRRGLDRT